MILLDLARAAERLSEGTPAATVDPMQCLHRWNNLSTCDICVQACPTDAISLEDQVQVNAEACIRCGLCLHVCPTGAFTGRSSTHRLLHAAEQLLDKSVVEVACKLHPDAENGDKRTDAVLVTNGCLAEFGASAYVGLRAVGVEKVRVRMDACADCPMGMHKPIQQAVTEADHALGGEGQIAPVEAPRRTQKRPTYPINNPPLTRRGFFKTLTQQEVSLADQITALAPEEDPKGRRVPHERQRLLNALTLLGAESNDYQLEDGFTQLTVSADTCTGCGMCERICPTGAIKFDSKRRVFAINFTVGSCVDCDLCVSWCEPNALTKSGKPTVREVVDSAPKTLHSGELIYTCRKCGVPSAVPYPDDLCPICSYRERTFGSFLKR